MRGIPVDVSAFVLVMAVKAPEPAVNQDGQQRKSVDGAPLMSVEVAFTPADGGPASVERVRVPADQVDRRIGAGTPVVVTGLSGRSWQMNGQAGVSFTARSVKFAGPPAAGGSSSRPAS